MNFKKTLGLVLTAALVSSSLVAVKPVKAATSALTGFNYFYAQRSLLVENEADTYVVDTNYSGKVQYELWVKKASDPSAKWQVVSADANGKAGYTEAVDGQNSPYAIKLVSGFTFDKGKYYTAVYAKVAGTAGVKTYGHFIDANGVDTDSKSGTEQKYDIVKSGYFNAMSTDYKQKYNEMLDDFLFDKSSFVAGQKVTFKGFASQKSGAKYKLVVRKFGTAASSQAVLNSTFASTVDWTPTEAGTYQVIAWSEPTNAGKNAARDGWRIDTITVTPAAPVQQQPKVDETSITTKAGMILGQTFVQLKLTGTDDPSKCTVSFGNQPLKYDAESGTFYGNLNSVDLVALKKAASYTVVAPTTPSQTSSSIHDTTGSALTVTLSPSAEKVLVSAVLNKSHILSTLSVDTNDLSVSVKVTFNGTTYDLASASDVNSFKLAIAKAVKGANATIDDYATVTLGDFKANNLTATLDVNGIQYNLAVK